MIIIITKQPCSKNQGALKNLLVINLLLRNQSEIQLEYNLNTFFWGLARRQSDEYIQILFLL